MKYLFFLFFVFIFCCFKTNETNKTYHFCNKKINISDSLDLIYLCKYKKYDPKKFDDPQVSCDSINCIIPFNKVGNLILIKAKADSTEGNFIFDTGAPGLILNLTYFRNYPNYEMAESEASGITGSVNSISPTFLKKIDLGPIHYKKIIAERVNLGHIENSKGVKILGLLGLQYFKQFEVIIDYEKSQLNLHLISKKDGKAFKSEFLNDANAYNTFDISITNNKLFVNGNIGKKKLIFMIDSGAESNVIDSRLPDVLFDKFSIIRNVNLSGTGSTKVQAVYGDMEEVDIGILKLKSLPFIVTNLGQLCIAIDKCIDGILGFEFLSLNKVGFNFVSNKMYIWK